METEQQLLEAIGRGERNAQRRLYDRFAGLAMATALRYVGDPDRAQDVVQDSFVSILTSVSRFNFRGEGSLRAWVKRLVANCSIDLLRQQERFVFTDDIDGEALSNDFADENTEPPPIDRLPPEVLNGLIAQLPPGYRAVLNLYVFEQMPHREIAKQLGIKADTSASQLSRAKRLLEKMIREQLKRQAT